MTVQRSFVNELGNQIKITIEGPDSTSENTLTKMEAMHLCHVLAQALLSKECIQTSDALASPLASSDPEETISPYEWLAQEFDRLAILRKMWTALEVAAMIRRHDIYRTSAALPPQGELREALDAKIRERIRVFLLVRESARADDYPWAQLNDATDIFRAIDAALAGRTAG
jgi:hypothetical protein